MSSGSYEFSEQEVNLLQLLTQARNSYDELDGPPPDERKEFDQHMRILTGLVKSCAIRRSNIDWQSFGKGS